MSKTVPVRDFDRQPASLLEETAEILSDDATLEAIRRGLDDLAAGAAVSLEQVREEIAARDSS